ncbi:MAG: pyruvate ferredoxin/flavodoxin oxidoreductase, partial [Geminicoccaceae bacterium]|nr:pyruvate ferredoxin/flavodoxin oxidoreductase [Geminicoccaceae bacterium]
RRVAFLTDYQDAAYAERYRALVLRVRQVEAERAPGRGELTDAVARYYFKLLAYKDEYEVARLYTNGEFRTRLASLFEDPSRLRIHLAPPLWAACDPTTGELRKRAYGPWILVAMRWLAKLRRLRGTAFDPFGYSAERRTERRLIGAYEEVVDELLTGLGLDNHELAVAIARIPEQIRGYGHVKQRHLERARQREAELLAAYRTPSTRLTAAE